MKIRNKTRIFKKYQKQNTENIYMKKKLEKQGEKIQENRKF